MSAVAAGTGVLLHLTLVLPVSRGGKAPTPAVSLQPVVAARQEPDLAPSVSPGTTVQLNPCRPALAGSMVPRPEDLEDLVRRADVIVLGTIDLVLAEMRIGAYGE